MFLIDGIETKKSLKDTIYYRLGDAGVQAKKLRYGVRICYVRFTRFLQAYTPSKHFTNCVKCLEKKHGTENIVAIAEHYDETNPHVHVIVVPIIKKEVRWKDFKR